jgi:nucleoside-diphosphate-sugar epimerase
MTTPRSVFVAGATGVLGRRVVPLLVAAGHSVTAVARSAEKRTAVERQGAAAVSLDLFDRSAVHDAVGGHDVVVNLATHIPAPSHMLLPGAWHENDRIRREVSANLAAAAVETRASRYVQESFAPIYEDAGDGWIDEASPVRPARYNRSVLDAEDAADRMTRDGRVGVALRFGLFYGPDDPATHATVAAIRRGWMPFPGSPDAYLSMVSHDDAASAVLAALDVPAGIYNVVDAPITRGDFAEGVAAMVGAPPPRFVPEWASTLAGSLVDALARSLRISNRKLREASRWAPRAATPLDGWRGIVDEPEGQERGSAAGGSVA